MNKNICKTLSLSLSLYLFLSGPVIWFGRGGATHEACLGQE